MFTQHQSALFITWRHDRFLALVCNGCDVPEPILAVLGSLLA
jgi:hypothetical protein